MGPPGRRWRPGRERGSRGPRAFAGRGADEQLPALLGAPALVLPSRDRSETFGLSLLEAMAAGVPVIASDLPTGVRELCRPGETGWLATPGEVSSLRQAVTEALADPDEARRRGEAGRAARRRAIYTDADGGRPGALVPRRWYAG